MPGVPGQPPPAAAAGRCHPARWAEPLPAPGPLGLAVAALVGATAAASWTLAAWHLHHADARHQAPSHIRAACPATSAAHPAELAGAAQYRAPVVPCSTGAAKEIGDLPPIIERRRHGIGLYFVTY